MNIVILKGRLSKDVEIRHTQSGKAVASFTIAVDRPNARKAQQGQQTADFINCVAWEHTAEFLGKYFAKGSPILAEGRLQVRKYQDKNGQNRYATEVIAHEVEFAGSKAGGQQAQHGGNYPDDSDIPF